MANKRSFLLFPSLYLSPIHAHMGIKWLKHRLSFKSETAINTMPKRRPASKDSKFACGICMEDKPQKKEFKIKGCKHAYCSNCIARHVESKVQENITLIKCPEMDCSSMLDPQSCRAILTQKLFNRWSKALCESLIPGAHSFYCPYKDCSALLINDDAGSVIVESECPHCHRMFCVQCKVPWHAGITCAEFKKLRKGERDQEDIMLWKLAKDNNWQRCPKCHFYVERTEGCLHMKCRCGNAFCYNCGARIGWDHNCSCSRYAETQRLPRQQLDSPSAGQPSPDLETEWFYGLQLPELGQQLLHSPELQGPIHEQQHPQQLDRPELNYLFGLAWKIQDAARVVFMSLRDVIRNRFAGDPVRN